MIKVKKISNLGQYFINVTSKWITANCYGHKIREITQTNWINHYLNKNVRRKPFA